MPRQRNPSLRWRWWNRVNGLDGGPAFQHAKWNGMTYAVAAAMWAHSAEDGGSIRPSDARIAQRGMSIHTVKDHRKTLQSLNMIRLVSGTPGRGTAPVYSLVEPSEWLTTATATEPEPGADVAEPDWMRDHEVEDAPTATAGCGHKVASGRWLRLCRLPSDHEDIHIYDVVPTP